VSLMNSLPMSRPISEAGRNSTDATALLLQEFLDIDV
jgi:hypothetical protein